MKRNRHLEHELFKVHKCHGHGRHFQVALHGNLDQAPLQVADLRQRQQRVHFWVRVAKLLVELLFQVARLGVLQD